MLVRHERRAGGPAEWRGVIVRQPDALRMQLVQIEGLEKEIFMTTQISLSLVVRHDEDDVGRGKASGFGSSGGICRRQFRHEQSAPADK